MQVDEGNKVFLVGRGVGLQIYTCNGSAWTTGGLTPPAADCNAATANTMVEVP